MTELQTIAWTPAMLAGIDPATRALPVLSHDEAAPIAPGLDLWDMWQIADRDGRTVIRDGRSWWFFLAAPKLPDPEMRHDVARIRLTSHGADGWRDHGETFPDGFTPGSREWSGSAVLAPDGETLTMYFTAAGRRDGPRTFEQRLFETTGRFVGDRTEGWTTPVESVAADGRLYAVADQAEPANGGILGFRDPGYFRDPADGAEYLTFTGSAGADLDPAGGYLDGVIGLARRDADGWALLPPLVTAAGVNSELERAHIVHRDGRYWLFWTTQAKKFAPGTGAPTGLYAMVADAIAGPWRPVNGTGLVAGNPPAEPFQAYCWWVTGEFDVLSFVDYPALGGRATADDPALRRATFGGTAAPFFRLAADGDRLSVSG